jgi:hypothetical protein
MSDVTDKVVAIKAVIDRVQPDTAPTLTFGEVALEVDRAQLAKTWTVNTAYNIGDIIVPAIRNGHYYECVQPGTSQGSVLSYTDWPTYTGGTRGDGSSDPQLIWEEAGSDVFNPGIFGAERNVYDISRAIKNCIGIKITRCAQFVNDGDTSFSDLYDHWTKEAEKYYPYRRPITLVRC